MEGRRDVYDTLCVGKEINYSISFTLSLFEISLSIAFRSLWILIELIANKIANPTITKIIGYTSLFYYFKEYNIKAFQGEWLSCTKGNLDFILTVLELNLTSPALKEFEYKVERED